MSTPKSSGGKKRKNAKRCIVPWCSRKDGKDGSLARVPTGQSDAQQKARATLLRSLGRDEAWTSEFCRKPMSDLRLCREHVSEATGKVKPLAEDPLWPKAKAAIGQNSQERSRKRARVEEAAPASDINEDVVATLMATPTTPLARRDKSPRSAPKDRSQTSPPDTSHKGKKRRMELRYGFISTNFLVLTVSNRLRELEEKNIEQTQEIQLLKQQFDHARAATVAAEKKTAELAEQLSRRVDQSVAIEAQLGKTSAALSHALENGVALNVKQVLHAKHAQCEHLTGLPKDGFARLLKLCKDAGFDRLFRESGQRFQLSHQGNRPTSKRIDSAPGFNPALEVPKANVGWEDLVLMLTMELKWDLGVILLAFLFKMTQSYVSARLQTVATLLEDVLRNTVGRKRTVPANKRLKCFGPDTPFANVTHIADTTLLRTEKPRHHALQHLMWSTYMPGHKLKAFVSIGPDGYPNFVSDLYPSSYSDKDIAVHSGFFNQLQPGDALMYDKGGVNMHDATTARGAALITPSFVCKGYLNPGEIHFSRYVASARVHIERVNERIKRFRWAAGTLMTTEYDNMDNKWRICVWLTCFMGPLCEDGGRGLHHLQPPVAGSAPVQDVTPGIAMHAAHVGPHGPSLDVNSEGPVQRDDDDSSSEEGMQDLRQFLGECDNDADPLADLSLPPGAEFDD